MAYLAESEFVFTQEILRWAPGQSLSMRRVTGVVGWRRCRGSELFPLATRGLRPGLTSQPPLRGAFDVGQAPFTLRLYSRGSWDGFHVAA